ncbi:Dolichyl-phosphate-mannose-protein mannosyltransferase [Cognatiyoonia koreensis]|uniref:Dolichyl-phosphate-mannose-protein mannosyltransferase n=1 Tax=Cognatiyoonia koreensis TaxID=364200 RepID=A0A1I0RT07_9RHOB|nr:glycosyltransferase family 39 protein [Cognatiyoonia koreensis]SEW44500.1 Dolichyl-phosphate-mannose-protein mannosyltransferase [Cognatiyoonia koreensis]
MTFIRTHVVWLWPVGLAVLVLLTQSGALVREVIDWDESTFMLLASDLRDGTLPYVERFDNKPPMLFFIFAGWMSLFGESVQSARFLGDFSMWIVAVTIFFISRRYVDDLAAVSASALYVAIHAVEPGLHTSAALPAMAAVMVALLLLLVYPRKSPAVFCAGILVGIAVLTRSNLAYMAVASGLLIAVLGLIWPGRFGFVRMSPFAYGAGGMVPLAIILGIFANGNALHELWLASVEVAISYSKEWKWGPIIAGVSHVRVWIRTMSEAPYLYVPFTILTVLGIVASLWPQSADKIKKPLRLRQVRMEWALIWVFLISIQWSILNSGSLYGHYWLQFFPLTCLFVAVLIGRLQRWMIWRGLALVIVLIPVMAAMVRVVPTSLQVLTKHGYATEQYDILAASIVLDDMMAPDDRVWALSNHLILHYLNLPTVSRVVAHPSNIVRESITTPLEEAGYIEPDELRRVMESLPEFIVSDASEDLFYFKDRSLIPNYLEENYDLVHATPIITIYRLKEGSAAN